MIAKGALRTPKRTDKDEVDRVIDWYEKFKPAAGRSLEVNLFPADLGKFARENDDGTFSYRGRTLVPVKRKTPSVRVWNKSHQEQIDRATDKSGDAQP